VFSRQTVRIILAILIPLAGFEAWWMTPDSDYWKPMDFAVFYTASRAFLHGQNPYDRSTAEPVWTDGGGDWDDDGSSVMDMVLGKTWDGQPPKEHWLPIEVIPPGLLVFGAFSAFDAHTAWEIWNIVVALLLVGQTYAIIRLMNRPLWDIASLAVILLTLLLDPLHIGLANGQPTVPTVSLIVMCLWFSRSGRPWIAGACFAIAVALKPQLAAPFVILLLFQGRRKTVVNAAVIGVILTGAAVWRMHAEHIDWFGSWASEVHYAEQPGGIDDARPTNPGRHDLLYLATIGHLFTDKAVVVNAAAFGTFAVLTGLLLWTGRRDRNSPAVVAAFSVVVLMPMYHRFYDAFILVIPGAWALTRLFAPSPGTPGEGRGEGDFELAGGPASGTHRDPVPHPGHREGGPENVAAKLSRVALSAWTFAGKHLIHALAIYVLAIIATYFVSEEYFNQSIFLHYSENPAIASAWWFRDFLEPHHAWEMLAVFAATFTAVAVTTPVVRRETAADSAAGLAPPGWWRRNAVRLAVAALIPLAVCEAWWMEPDSDTYKPMDFAMYYTAGRMFLHGENPYNRARSIFTWDEADTTGEYWDVMEPILGPRSWDDKSAPQDWLPVNLMPAGVVVMSSVAWMTIPRAWPAWNTLVGLLLLGQVWSINRLMKVRFWDWRTLAVVVLTILLEPLHIGLANGQPAVPAVALTVIALWLSSVDRQVLGGIALAVATALKPQLAGPFLIYFLWLGQWKLSAVAVGVGIALTLAAVIPMQAHGLHWLQGWVTELKYAEVPGGINDPRRKDGGRDDMLHLQLFFHAFTDNGLIATGLAWTVVLSTGAAMLSIARGGKDLLGVMACFAVLSLLPLYHRLYDAGILVVPLAWAVMNITGRRRWPAAVILLVISLYFVSQQRLDDWFIAQSGLDWTVSSWWFNAIAEPHHPLELLVILGCLMRGLSMAGPGAGPPPAPRFRPSPELAAGL
jgi:hypothetical protein